MGAQELAKELGRTAASANHRRGKIGLRNPNTWKPRETRFLQDHPDRRPKELVQHVDHGVVAIRIRRWHLDLNRYVERVEWTENEIQMATEMLQSHARPFVRPPEVQREHHSGMQTKLGRRCIRRRGYGMTNGYKVVFRNRRPVFEHRIIMGGCWTDGLTRTRWSTT